MAIFLTVLPRAEFRTQPKVYGGVFLQKYLTRLAVNFFCKKSPTINVPLCSKNASVACKEKRNKLSYMILHNFI